MTLFETILFAISLGVDCFTVSIASGIILKRYNWPVFVKMAFFFGLFQALMPLIGWLAAFQFASLIQDYDHWIAFALLAFLGFRMIKEGCKNEEECIFIPTKLNVNLTLALATSIDPLAVGVTFAFMQMNGFKAVLGPISMIGIASFLMSLAGSIIGVTFGKRFRFRMEIVGGIVLIGIGTKILIEHLLGY